MDWRALLTLCCVFSLSTAYNSGGFSVSPVSPPQTGSPSPTRLPSTSTTAATGSSSIPCRGATICCGNPTIRTAAELKSLSSCPTFYGNVVLDHVAMPTATGVDTPPAIEIPMTEIQGSLEVSGSYTNHDTELVTISMSSLRIVGRALSFKNMARFQRPYLPLLQTVDSINFQNISFASTVRFSAPYSVQGISFDGTNLEAIGPFTSDGSEPLDLYIQNNTQCASLTIPNVGVLGTAIINNNLLTNLSLADVTHVNGLLEINQNKGLTNLSLPALQSVGTMIVESNDQLKIITLPSLNNIGKSMVLSGPIASIHLPNFTSTTGTIDIDSSVPLNCHRTFHNVSIPQGHLTCKSPSQLTSATSSTPSSTTSASSSHHVHGSSGLSMDATIGIGVGVGVGGVLLLGLVLFFCWRSRRKSSHAPRGASKEHSSYSGKGNYYTYREVPFEASGSKQVHAEPQSEEQTPTSGAGMGEGWVPPEPTVPITEGRTELEEQQGQRHEMDARSIDFGDDDEEAETRSLEDIERVHRQR